jgi:hypothetical protein
MKPGSVSPRVAAPRQDIGVDSGNESASEVRRSDQLRRWSEVALLMISIAVLASLGLLGTRNGWPPGEGLPYAVMLLSAPPLLCFGYGMLRRHWPIRFGWAASIAFWALAAWVVSASIVDRAIEPPAPPGMVAEGTFAVVLALVSIMALPLVAGCVMAGQAAGRRLFDREQASV